MNKNTKPGWKPTVDFGFTEEDWEMLGAPMAHRMTDRVHARMQRIMERHGEDDPAILALPHPQRSRYMRQIEVQEMTFGEEWPALKEIIADTSLPLATVVERCSKLSRTFSNMYSAMLLDPSGINGGSLGATLMSLRHQLAGGAMFQTTDELDEMLSNTDISDDIPIGMIRAPFPVCYFEFGETRRSPLRVWNDSTGDHIAEGCYLIEYEVENYRNEPAGRRRHLILVQTGMPKASVGDDALQLFTIPILDEGASINETIEAYIELHHTEVRQTHREDPSSPLRHARKEAFDQAKDFLRHVLKILLYLSTEDHSERRITDGSDAMKAMSAIKSSAKRAKAERRADKVYDRILLGAKRPTDTQKGVSADTGTGARKISKVFWRRGHFRNQPFGEGRSQRKHIWIKPTLVQGDVLSDSSQATPQKPYVIR